MKHNKILKKFELLGDRYIQTHLNNNITELEYNITELETNWWEGLKFFFSKSFMRGRRDELSKEYLKFTINRLKTKYDIKNNLNLSYDKLVKDKKYFNKSELLKFKKEKSGKKISDLIKNQNPIYNLLISEEEIRINQHKKKIHLGNIEDIMMVFDVLNFITGNEGENENKKNIYSYILDKLKENKTNTIYQELKSSNFRAISDKIATFIIRDIYLLNPNISIKNINNNLAFPIDTWVRQITDKINPALIIDKERKEFLIKECLKLNLNPLKVAAGIWYLGANSLRILIDNLEGIKNLK